MVSVFILLASTIEAQTFVGIGGGTSASFYSSTAQLDATMPVGFNLHLAPEVGYNWDDQLRAGVRLCIDGASYTYSSNLYNPDLHQWDSSWRTQATHSCIGLEAYLRWPCLGFGNFDLWLELDAGHMAGIGGTLRHEKQVLSSDVLWERQGHLIGQTHIGLTPILSYRITDRLVLTAHLHLLSLACSHISLVEKKPTSKLIYRVDMDEGNSRYLSMPESVWNAEEDFRTTSTQLLVVGITSIDSPRSIAYWTIPHTLPLTIGLTMQLR